ncbi:MAG: hypothetical protein HOY79_43145 [Streptomyces sp.]|nr:hypothetical protein [Streptomyces sp.]
MTTLIQNKDVRTISAGLAVTRAAATIPQTAAQNIFTISGGRILIVALTGQVTTAIGGTAVTLKVTNTPTSGTATDIASATAITSKEVGTLLGLPLTPGSALVVGANAGAAVQVPGHQGWLVEPGTLSVTTSASTTGAISYDLVYIPYDTGASVAAA